MSEYVKSGLVWFLHFFDGNEGARGEARHDKYYRIYQVGTFVTVHYGRDGTSGPGTVKTEHFKDVSEALIYSQRLARSKYKKGYKSLYFAPITRNDRLLLESFGSSHYMKVAGSKILSEANISTESIKYTVIIDEEDIFDLLNS